MLIYQQSNPARMIKTFGGSRKKLNTVHCVVWVLTKEKTRVCDASCNEKE